MNSPNRLELDLASLRHADSFKWTAHGPDVLELWVADMDYAIAPSIAGALTERLTHPIGYHHVEKDPHLTSLLLARMQRQGFTDLPAEGWVHFITGVVPGLYAAILALTEPGDEVVTFTPIYPPFLSAITDHGRVAKHVRLAESENGWELDLPSLEAAVTTKTRVLLICHPHNPTGRVWTPRELGELAAFAERHHLFVVTDELHSDLVLDGPFVPFTSIASPAVRDRTLTLTGPCKTYNTAGLGIGAIVSHNAPLLKRVKNAIRGISGHPGAMSVTMWRAALLDDGQWLTQVLQQLRERRAQLADFVQTRLPDVRLFPPQATYLAWLDYRAHPQAREIHKVLLERAKVALIPGTAFGPGYEGFARLNFATSQTILGDALERMATINA